MKSNGSYITEEKKEELKEELAHLSGEKRKEILSNLEYAKSLGDLSENAEYHQAREDQGKLEARIATIQEILRSSEVVIHSGGEEVTVGSYVTVVKTGEKDSKTYQMVGAHEADTSAGKISNLSPMGLALFGKKKGDTASVKTPSVATVDYKITKVS